MSNWNGAGLISIGEEFLWLSTVTDVYSHTKAIHVHEDSIWLEGEGVVPIDYSRFKPIKTDDEKSIDELTTLITGLCWSSDIAKALHESGYHNQPKVKKVKELNVSEWLCSNGYGKYDSSAYAVRDLVNQGHIIEAKEKDSE